MPTPQPKAATAKRFYLTFNFGIRHAVGPDVLPMWNGWVEIVAMSRGLAIARAAQRFGGEDWQIHTEEAFTQDRRKFYPQGCRLVLWQE